MEARPGQPFHASLNFVRKKTNVFYLYWPRDSKTVEYSYMYLTTLLRQCRYLSNRGTALSAI